MNTTARKLATTWIIGVIAGTALVAFTSPLFVRSYLPLHADPIRHVWTLPAGQLYRWRSEGYADTHVGPQGMPGKTSIDERRDSNLRVALWGDSQAEGVCVDDDSKLFAQAEQASGGQLQLFPFARSGEDAADWLTQIPAVEHELSVDVHVMLVAQLSDLLPAPGAPLPPPSDEDVAASNSAIAARVPAFVVQGARRLLTEPDDVTRRKLRFHLGPVADRGPSGSSGPAKAVASAEEWTQVMQAIRDASDLPILLLYAPLSPQIIDGQILWDDATATDFTAMKVAAETAGLRVVDARHSFRDSVLKYGVWPHGFHNGNIGSGHLNLAGNGILGGLLAAAVLDLREQEH